MKRAIYFIAAAVLTVFISASDSSCMYMIESEDGNGHVVKQERDVSPFRAIRIGGSFEVSLIQGDRESLVVEADENLMEFITAEVSGHTLIVSSEKNLRNYDRLRLFITFRELDLIDVSGAVNLYGDEKLTLDDLALEASGASEVNLDLEASSLSVESSGASHISLAGRCREASLESSGASGLKAADLETEKFTLSISGAGEASVFVTNTLDVNVSGASHIKYKGNPPNIKKATSGASSLSKMD